MEMTTDIATLAPIVLALTGVAKGLEFRINLLH